MNASTTTATTINAAPAAAKRSWKEFRGVVCAVIWAYLTYPSRKAGDLVRQAADGIKAMYTKYVYGPIQSFVSKTIAFLKATVYGLAGTAALIACLTGGLVYAGVLDSSDVKDVVIEITPRSWMQAAYDIGIAAPYAAAANTDGYVRKSTGL